MPTSRRSRTALLATAMICVGRAALAQSAGCALVPDTQNPAEQILKCGDSVTIRSERGARYQLEAPDTARLDSGAVMIEFQPGAVQKSFQILTPLAIASVRGTKWVVDSQSSRMSAFVVSGHVAVTRRSDGRSALLGPGEGADIDARPGPVSVKRWPETRVKALMARFGQ